MKKTLLLALSAAWTLTVSAQSAWDEIRQNPVLAAGKYMAYQAPEEKQINVPEGYEPFYLSAFARHGSRYLTKQKKYDEPLATLEAAQNAGKLTPDGQRTLDIIRRMAREAQGRYGELTPKGARQHRELAARLMPKAVATWLRFPLW